MKFISSLFGLYLMLALISCNKDEAEENEANILGAWQSTDVALRDCEDENNNRLEKAFCPGEDCIRYSFSLDSTKTRTYVREIILPTGSEFETGTFSASETKIDFCIDHEGVHKCQTSRFAVSESTLVLLSEDPGIQCFREIKLIKEKDNI